MYGIHVKDMSERELMDMNLRINPGKSDGYLRNDGGDRAEEREQQGRPRATHTSDQRRDEC